MKALISLLYLFNLHAYDPDQKINKCGEYEAYAKIICIANNCRLSIGDSKLSKLSIKLRKSSYNLSYFHDRDIMMNIGLEKLGDDLEAKPLSNPVQQMGAIKRAGLNLKKAKACK